MFTVRHSLEVESTLDEAFRICAEIERWPKIFPPCQKVDIINQDEHWQLFEITALADKKTMTWQSERHLDYNSHTIYARQVKPSVLVKSMQCAWRFYPLRDGILISLEHRIKIKDDVQGLMENIYSKEDARAFMEKVIHENSELELWSIKKILECGNSKGRYQLDFQEELLINSKHMPIYSLLRDAKKWPDILPHCRHVDVIYDDGKNQEFIMAVDVRGKEEKIRSIRRCLDSSSIQYFQPAPPPVLRQHTGEWMLKPEKSGTRVVSKHSIQLNPEMITAVLGDMSVDDALDYVKNAINKNSMTTLQSIDEYLRSINP